jgi:hypothetical protein
MLKFLHVARISNFHTFLVDFSHDFKQGVLSCLDELLDLPCMVKRLEMSNFLAQLESQQTSTCRSRYVPHST